MIVMLTAKEAADRLGVTVRQLDRYVAAGLIAPMQTVARGHRKFDAEKVDKLLRGVPS